MVAPAALMGYSHFEIRGSLTSMRAPWAGNKWGSPNLIYRGPTLHVMPFTLLARAQTRGHKCALCQHGSSRHGQAWPALQASREGTKSLGSQYFSTPHPTSGHDYQPESFKIQLWPVFGPMGPCPHCPGRGSGRRHSKGRPSQDSGGKATG